MRVENIIELEKVLPNFGKHGLGAKIKAEDRVAEILLVDDDPGDVDLTIEILKRGKISHHLTVVDDGVKAIDHLVNLLKKNDNDIKIPDFIILDLNLPKKDGRKVLQWIKTHHKLKSIPVIVFTTSNAENDVKKCYFSGANCYITKPVEFSDFSKAVSSLENFWLNTVKISSHLLDHDGDSIDQALSEEPLKLLLVEDDPADVFFFQEIFKSEFVAANTIVHAENITSATELLQRESFDLIILDLCLAETRGIVTLDRILPSAGSIPIVVLTGMNDEKTGCEAIRKGAQDFLCKDQVDRKTLVRTLRYAFERNRIHALQRKNAEASLFQTKQQYTILADSVFKGIKIYRGDKFATTGF